MVFAELNERFQNEIHPLMSGIAQDTAILMESEAARSSAEFRQAALGVRRALIMTVPAAGAAVAAAILTGFALSQLLLALFPALPQWGAFALSALLFAALCGVLLWAALRQVTLLLNLPERTLQRLKEYLQWMRQLT